MAKFPKSLARADVSDIDLTAEEFIFKGERLTDERAGQLADVYLMGGHDGLPGHSHT